MADDVTYVVRVVLSDLDARDTTDYIRGARASSNEVVSYKALSRLNGNTRKKSSLSKYGEIKFKANALRQIGSSILSTAVPGDLSPLRSPVRSTVYRTLTPGFGGGRRGGSRPGENRAHRCPEGYQYGGRFTDNRFSTCGAKLFAIPSILGAAISEIRRAISGPQPGQATGRLVTGEPVDSSLIQSREPQIPRVGNENRPVAQAREKTVKQEIGKFLSSNSDPVRRMVRRDGFVLEPVVPNNVLRAIPDNRDMEGATFIMGTLDTNMLGSEELGLLSNTGIQNLSYVFPGGSTVSIQKARKLTVGERRKLGRVVNASMEMDNSKNALARLENVANELPGAIVINENFIGINDPKELLPSGKQRWVAQLLSGKKGKKPARIDEGSSQEIGEAVSRRRKIANIDVAIEHVQNGGSLSDIDPSIIGELVTKTQAVKRQKINNDISMVEDGSGKYVMYENPAGFQHLGEMYASAIHSHLGLPSTSIIPVGEPGEKRQYLRQDVESVLPDAKFDPTKNLNDLSPEDVARIMVSDFLSDQRLRLPTSIYPITSGGETRPVLAQNITSGLTDLSKIQITARMKQRLRDFYDAELSPAYSDYYQQLKSEQRIIFIRFINQLIQRARSFSPRKTFKNTDGYGISEGERIHINILTKLFESRLEVLSSQKNDLRSILGG